MAKINNETAISVGLAATLLGFSFWLGSEIKGIRNSNDAVEKAILKMVTRSELELWTVLLGSFNKDLKVPPLPGPN